MFEKLKAKGFEILMLHHAEAILLHDMQDAAAEIEEILLEAELPVSELVSGGGGEGKLTQRLRRGLSEKYGWDKHKFVISKVIDGQEKESTSHEIDHVKRFETGTFALEIEWNNKDPFYDRDLENFKRLHADGVISVGGIITRGRSLQESLGNLLEEYATQYGLNDLDAISKFYTPTPRQRLIIERATVTHDSFEKGWAHVFVADKFGKATTRWEKLEDRVKRGVGNPCPLLLIGLPKAIVSV